MSWREPGPGGGGGGGGGAGGSSCPGQDQPLPTRAGELGSTSQSCSKCCDLPGPGSGEGEVEPCGDCGCGSNQTCTGHSANISPTGNAASGASPLTVDYTLDLTALPAGAKIRSAVMIYGFTASMSSIATRQVVDPYGSVTNGSSITWGVAGILALNSVIGTGFPLSVSATCTFTCNPQPFPCAANFSAALMQITYVVCD